MPVLYLKNIRGRVMQAKRKEALLKFCERLHISVNDLEMVNVALTHTSYAHEAKEKPRPNHNERVEFLGDSVLSLIVSSYMFSNYPNLKEGELTKLRAHIVCEASLASYAHKIGLGEFLQLGRGEDASGGRERASILADAFESLLGAYYLDSGFAAAQEFLLGLMKPELDFICTHGILSDFKTYLQEIEQRDGDVDISYELLNMQGPEHDKNFYVAVYVNGQLRGNGSGHTKKEAEQQAAKDALQRSGDIKKDDK